MSRTVDLAGSSDNPAWKRASQSSSGRTCTNSAPAAQPLLLPRFDQLSLASTVPHPKDANPFADGTFVSQKMAARGFAA